MKLSYCSHGQMGELETLPIIPIITMMMPFLSIQHVCKRWVVDIFKMMDGECKLQKRHDFYENSLKL